MWDWMDGWSGVGDTPLTVMTTRAPAYGAKNYICRMKALQGTD